MRTTLFFRITMIHEHSDESFIRLLCRYKRSVWRQVWKQLLGFLVIYFAINLFYRFVLPTERQLQFELIVINTSEWSKYIPITTFVLGFYVSIVVRRWWEQLLLIRYPDKFLLLVNFHIKGQDDESRIIRRTLARYTTLIAVLVWREMSVKVKVPVLKSIFLAIKTLSFSIKI